MADIFALTDHNAIVTGATSGLGRQFALTLARAGARVAITGRRADRLEELAGEIAAFDGRAMPFELDVNDIEAVHRVIDATETELGPLSILINNAGVSVEKMATEVTVADYDRLMNTNLKAPFFVAQEVGRRMIQHGKGGSIVNIASIAAERPVPMLSLYCMSKAAVAHMTRCLALEWARHGINVNAICPGYIETEMNQDFFASEQGARLIKRFPRGRVGEPRDLDALLLMLAASAGGFITGAVIPAHDGQALA
ncbi:MAG: glucose 1-dehydrogenase [Sphingomonadales bacterium]